MSVKKVFQVGSTLVVSSLLLGTLAGCGKGGSGISDLQGVRDNGSILFVKAELLEGNHPSIPGSDLYFLLMTGKDPAGELEARAYAIDCQGSNMKILEDAFGFDSSSPKFMEKNYEDLKIDYKIEEQPIFRCSSIKPSPGNQMIKTVFQVIKDDQNSEALPDIFVRFNRLQPGDSNLNEDKFYSVGCRNFLDKFGSDSQRSLANAVPILASTAKSIFPEFGNIAPINCMSETTDILSGWSVKHEADLPENINLPNYDANLKLFKVKDPNRGNPYLLSNGKKSTVIDCANVKSEELLKVFGWKDAIAVEELAADNAEYLNARKTPMIECRNPTNLKFFDKKIVTIRDKPALNLYRKARSKTYFEFGCSEVEAYFTDGKSIQENDIKITHETANFLRNDPSSKFVQIPCFGAPKMSQDAISQEIKDAFGRNPFSNEMARWTEECRKPDGRCSPEIMREELVKTTQSDINWTFAVIQLAFKGQGEFPGALGREPFPEEMDYFLKQSKDKGPHRPHYKEIREFLKATKYLDRAVLVQSVAEFFGTDFFANTQQYWTTQQFNEPSRTFGREDFNGLHKLMVYIGYGANDQATHQKIALRAYHAVGSDDPTDEQIENLRQLVGEEKLQASFTAYVNALNTYRNEECVTIQATSEEGNNTFPLFMKHSRISRVEGAWNSVFGYVGPDGYGEAKYENYNRIDWGKKFGALMYSWMKDDGAWEYFHLWSDQASAPSNKFYLVMNDAPGLFGDNSGELKVCFQ